MTPDLEGITEVFLARILAMVARARGHLEENPARGELLIAGSVESGRSLTVEESAAIREEQLADLSNRQRLAMPHRSTTFIYPQGFVNGHRIDDGGAIVPHLPFETTYTDAVRLAEVAAPGLATRMAAELVAAVDDLTQPEPSQVREAVCAVREQLAEDWPISLYPRTSGTLAVDAVSKVVAALADYLPVAGHLHPLLGRAVPDADTAREVARWSAPRLDAAYVQSTGGRRTDDLDDVGQTNGDISVTYADEHGRLLSLKWGDRNFDAAGIILVWRAVRAARARLFALDAAREARRAALDLVNARNPGDGIFAALDYALALETERPDTAADGWKADPVAVAAGRDEGIRGRLAGELFAAAVGVARTVLAGPEPTDEAEARTAARTATVALAVALERQGREGGARAERVRARAAERAEKADAGEMWAVWIDGTPHRWLCLLALTLWADKWRPELARELRPVALPVANLSRMLGAFAAVDVQPGPDGRRVLVGRSGTTVARFEVHQLATAVEADALERLARAGVRELATVTAARFVSWFAHKVQRRPDETAPMTFEGGDGVGNAYGAVAAAMGMDPEKHGSGVRAMLCALNCTMLAYPDGSEAGVLLLDYRPGGGRGNPSRLTLTPGRPWLARDVFELPDGSGFRALAPIPVLPDYAPPFVGDRRERGALLRLYLRILAELAKESSDISRGMGAHIPGSRWAELAREEGVIRPPPLLVGLIQDRWTRDGDDGPAVFERVGPERWHLAAAFEAERRLLEEGGKQRIGASAGGTLSAKLRSEARGRLADGLGRGKRAPKGKGPHGGRA